MAKKRKRKLKKWVKLAILFILLLFIACASLFIIKSLKNSTPTNSPVAKLEPTEMEDLYFYDKTRKDRYEAYQQKHPEYPFAQVVWQVNIDMDKENYTEMTMISEENENDIVLLVNKHFRLRDDYKPNNLTTYNGYYMSQETKDAFTKMANEASKEGIYLNPGSTYRSIAYQRDLYQSYANSDGVANADTYSARAGSSEHHTGRAIDLVGPDWTLDSFGGTEASQWVLQHGHEYGFIVRYKKATEYITGYIDEPWHITYVGIPCATTMHYRNIQSLEEYYVRFVMYSPYN